MPISQDPAQGQTQHINWRGPAFPGYRQSQGQLPLCKQKGLCSGKGGGVGYLIAAGLPLTWSVLLGCKKVFPAAPPPGAPCCQQCPVRDPHSSEMQSTQQACVCRWPQRRFLKIVNSTAGSSEQEGLWQATSTIPAGSEVLPCGISVQIQTPFLSSGMNTLPKVQRSCGDKAIQHQWVSQSSRSAL